MDLSEPADDEELLLLGPIHEPWICKTLRERQNNIADTVERVAAGKIEFVTEEMILNDKEDYYTENSVLTKVSSLSKTNSMAKEMMSKIYDKILRKKGEIDDIANKNLQRTIVHMQRFIKNEEEKIKVLTIENEQSNHTTFEGSFNTKFHPTFNVFNEQISSQTLSTTTSLPSLSISQCGSMISHGIEEETLKGNNSTRLSSLDVLDDSLAPDRETSPAAKGIRKKLGRPFKNSTRLSSLDVLDDSLAPDRETSPGKDVY